MTEIEHLLTCLSEECSEVTKNVCKAQRFGLNDSDPFKLQPVTNATTISLELTDLFAVAEMLVERGAIPYITNVEGIRAKKEKVLKMMQYAIERKTLECDEDHHGA